jgi:hypothetical protein
VLSNDNKHIAARLVYTRFPPSPNWQVILANLASIWQIQDAELISLIRNIAAVGCRHRHAQSIDLENLRSDKTRKEFNYWLIFADFESYSFF